MNTNRIWNTKEILGRMNQRIVIQSVTETRSTSGAVTETWATFATVWAGVKFQSGSENQLIERQTAKTTIQFTIRYRTDINEKMRISFDSKIYDILSIDPEPEKQFIFITAENNK